MVRLIAEGWLLGLSTGPYCLGACMPFMIPYLFAEGRPTWSANARVIGEFLLGRFLAYLLFGAGVGWIGGWLKPHLTQQAASLALGATAALMLLYALVKSLPHWTLCAWALRRLPMVRMPVALGFLIGINICPPFLVAVARLLQVGGLTSGAVFFLGFFAGTSLYTLPLLGVSPLTRVPRFQRIGTLSAVLVGGYYLAVALRG
ncbi:MAG: sulfite exporter TauE/SafE family protein [Candidatus Omnitrophica bacterium]|nr:sulfite exporter TauE/SafE family protein [Candidatus Omnitrophota bacterium]